MDHLFSPVCQNCGDPALFNFDRWAPWCSKVCKTALRYKKITKSEIGIIRQFCQYCLENPKAWDFDNKTYFPWCSICEQKKLSSARNCLVCKTPTSFNPFTNNYYKFCGASCRNYYIFQNQPISPSCLVCYQPAIYTVRDYWFPWCSITCQKAWKSQNSGFIYPEKLKLETLNRPICGVCQEAPAYWDQNHKKYKPICYSCRKSELTKLKFCGFCGISSNNTKFCSLVCRTKFYDAAISNPPPVCTALDCTSNARVNPTSGFFPGCSKKHTLEIIKSKKK